MGDRCYMTVTCRRADMGLFEELGFTLNDYGNEPTDPVVELNDQEANWAHSGELPRHVPFIGQHGSGDNYGPFLQACDGKDFVEVPGDEHAFGIEWDYHEGEPTVKSVAAIRQYLVLRKKVQRWFKQLQKHSRRLKPAT